MGKVRGGLFTLLLFAFAVWAIWQVVEPLIPYLVALLMLVLILGFVYARLTKW
jgi:hypothetical protein